MAKSSESCAQPSNASQPRMDSVPAVHIMKIVSQNVDHGQSEGNILKRIERKVVIEYIYRTMGSVHLRTRPTLVGGGRIIWHNVSAVLHAIYNDDIHKTL